MYKTKYGQMNHQAFSFNMERYVNKVVFKKREKKTLWMLM